MQIDVRSLNSGLLLTVVGVLPATLVGFKYRLSRRQRLPGDIDFGMITCSSYWSQLFGANSLEIALDGKIPAEFDS